MDDYSEFTDVASNPAAQSAIASVLEDANSDNSPKPVIPDPADAFVRLPGGLVVDGKRVTEAEVQELTGEHEERLDKARSSNDPTRWYNTLLQCGVVQIGGRPAEQVLDDLLVGDRDTLILAIREATYGSEVDMGEMFCPTCRETFDAVLDTSKDVKIRALKGEDTFEVKLRKGGKARVRLPNGADQTAYTSDTTLTDSERNSLLLSRCILTLPYQGEDVPVAAYPHLVREMGVADRQNVIREINRRQPGPRYDEVFIEHECGTKIPAPLGLVPLFPGL